MLIISQKSEIWTKYYTKIFVQKHNKDINLNLL